MGVLVAYYEYIDENYRRVAGYVDKIAGSQIAVKTVETATGAGSLFGIAIVPGGHGVYFVDDGDNTVKVLESRDAPERDDDGHE